MSHPVHRVVDTKESPKRARDERRLGKVKVFQSAQSKPASFFPLLQSSPIESVEGSLLLKLEASSERAWDAHPARMCENMQMTTFSSWHISGGEKRNSKKVTKGQLQEESKFVGRPPGRADWQGMQRVLGSMEWLSPSGALRKGQGRKLLACLSSTWEYRVWQFEKASAEFDLHGTPPSEQNHLALFQNTFQFHPDKKNWR